MGMGPLDPKTGKPSYIAVMDQWKKKRDISERKIYALGKSKEEGGRYDDSDNAETFWVAYQLPVHIKRCESKEKMVRGRWRAAYFSCE